MKFILDLMYLLAALIISPKVIYRMIRHKRYLNGCKQRLGRAVRFFPDKKCIWLHAVSVGEVNATKTIVNALQEKFPDFEIVITSTTDTGFACAQAAFSDRFSVSYFPLDFSWMMDRKFRNIRPALCLLMELEVWPNFMHIAKEKNIPVVIINGRITKKSSNVYRKVPLIAKKIFENIELVLAQTDQYARRFKQLGCPEVTAIGSLKYDTAQITDTIDGAKELAEKLGITDSQILWVAGGTGNDEEGRIIETYKKLKPLFTNLRLAVIPRKPERFGEVADLITNSDMSIVRYSSLKNNSDRTEVSDETVILGDTMGDLRKFYSLAAVVFSGRSLVPMGGSDMIESAALGNCIIFGPHIYNFEQTVKDLLENNAAIMVKDEAELFEQMKKCLSDTDFRDQTGRNAKEVIKNNQGTTEKIVEKIETVLKKQ